MNDISDNEVERLKEIIRRQNEEILLLKEENERLKHPGSASLTTILKYPMQQPKLVTNEVESTRKTFPFAQLVIADTYKILKQKQKEKQVRKRL